MFEAIVAGIVGGLAATGFLSIAALLIAWWAER